MNSLCPCGSQLTYDACCGPVIEGRMPAATAQALMRSRYVAFTLADVDYLMRSWHSRYRPVRDRKRIQAWAKSVKWMGLQIIATQAGGETDTSGMVEFRAMYLEGGQPGQIHERSIFEKEKGAWVYVKGEHFK